LKGSLITRDNAACCSKDKKLPVIYTYVLGRYYCLCFNVELANQEGHRSLAGALFHSITNYLHARSIIFVLFLSCICGIAGG
jgi:hypothetical protein